MTERHGELARTTLGVLFLLALIIGSLWVLLPFLAAFLWAVTIVVATWPLLLKLQGVFGGRRAPAVAVMTLALLAVFILPITVGVSAVITWLGDAGAIADVLASARLPPPPAWVAGLPVVGERAAAAWTSIATASPEQILAAVEPYARNVGAWFVHHAGTLAGLLVQFLITAILAAVLYASGEQWADWVRRFARRLAGDVRGERIPILAGQSIRGVALGVVVTALLQTVLGGIGVAVAGVPFASVLTAVMFLLCIAQLGPLIVLLLATAWVYQHSGPVAGSILLAWSLAVGLMDNFVRPVLIKRGADLPLLLIFTGVVGGLVSMGIIGIFVGPVVLAVTFTLLNDWMAPQTTGTPGEPV
jgi:predicted PurR-regulated permease PerM